MILFGQFADFYDIPTPVDDMLRLLIEKTVSLAITKGAGTAERIPVERRFQGEVQETIHHKAEERPPQTARARQDGILRHRGDDAADRVRHCISAVG